MLFWLLLELFTSYLSVYSKTTDLDCLSYSCNKNSKSGECISVSDSNITLSPCVSSYYCPVSSDSSPVSSNCAHSPSPYPTLPYAYPGEACAYGVDCFSGNCRNNTCAGALENSLCDASTQCDVGLYCNGRRCLPQKDENDGECIGDSYCKNGLGCNFTEGGVGTCVPYFTIPPGDPIAYCNRDTHVNKLCEYMMCWPNSRRTTVGVCASELKSKSILPTSCLNNTICVNQPDPVKKDEVFKTDCNCAYSPNPGSYCGLFPGDPFGMEYLNMLKVWVNSSQIAKCNSGREFSSTCMKMPWSSLYTRTSLDNQNTTSWTYMDYVSLLYYQHRYQDYSKYIDIESCAKEIYLSDLAYYQQLYYEELGRLAPNPVPYKDFGLHVLIVFAVFSLF